jgi:cytochrome c5
MSARLRPFALIVGGAALLPLCAVGQETPGEASYQRVCSKCHDKGKSKTPAGRGAPRLGDARAWESRIEKGIDSIYQKVISSKHGKADDDQHEDLKNFRQDLTDQQVRAVIEYMFEQVP